MKIAYEKAVDLLSRREHSEKEIRQKLKLRNIDSSEINQVVDRLKSHSYLSDDRYSRLLYQSCKNKGYGIQKIKLKFKQKGLQWSKELDHLEEEDVEKLKTDQWVSHWLEKKYKLLRYDETEKKKYEKLLRFLIQKGYSMNKAHQKVKEFLELKNEKNNEI